MTFAFVPVPGDGYILTDIFDEQKGHQRNQEIIHANTLCDYKDLWMLRGCREKSENEDEGCISLSSRRGNV